jgi:hypothetical protein
VRLRWSTRAAGQLFEAAAFLEHRAGAGEALYDAVDRLVGLIRDQPRAFPAEPYAEKAEIRRALLPRFGYWLIYRVQGDDVEVLVLSFWSTHRRPEGWPRSR